MNSKINSKKDGEISLSMDHDSVNDANQSVANQNPNQNTANQNAVFSGQNLKSIQKPFAQNLPLQTLQPKSKKLILIACIVGLLVLTLVVVGIVCVVILQDNNNIPNITLDAANVIDVEKFEQMTKAEAIAFLQAGRNTGGNIPTNYVGEEITDLVIVENNVVLSDVSLKYSHETIDDLRQMAEEWYGVLGHNDGITEDDYEIEEYDYYAIVIPNRIEETNTCDYDYYGSCNSLLSFNSNYINYYREETSPNSYHDVIYINTQNPELVERLLRTYSLFYDYGSASGHGNICGSSFEEQDDKFVLTVYYVGVGLNMEKLKADDNEIGYAINLYSRQLIADKLDGQLQLIRTGEDSTVNNIKSIPITQGEATQLLSR